jgi:glycosyltransferase involved in cell wall biosynthesis
MKRKIAGLYDPYLDSMGGGERHVLSMLEVFEKEADFDSVVFWDEDYSERIKKTLNLTFDHLSFEPNIFKHSGTIGKLNKLNNLDLFIYVTDGSYFFSTAKKNYIFCMVPKPELFNNTVLNVLKTRNFSYICNSEFTQSWLKNYGVDAQVLHPYIADDFLTLPLSHGTKEKNILVVGRFFGHLHSKRQDMAIKAFTELKKNPEFSDYKLVLAGNVLPSDQSYVDTLRAMIGKNPYIDLRTNVSFSGILELYEKSRFYWHFTGYGIDDTKEPERVEHFGITPLEAMASGCITFCYNAGGPKSFIHNGENGFLFSSVEELMKQMSQVLEHGAEMHLISEQARNYVDVTFSYERFKKNTLEVFGLL